MITKSLRPDSLFFTFPMYGKKKCPLDAKVEIEGVESFTTASYQNILGKLKMTLSTYMTYTKRFHKTFIVTNIKSRGGKIQSSKRSNTLWTLQFTCFCFVLLFCFQSFQTQFSGPSIKNTEPSGKSGVHLCADTMLGGSVNVHSYSQVCCSGLLCPSPQITSWMRCLQEAWEVMLPLILM